MLLSRGKKAPPEPFKFGDIVRIEKKVHVGYRYVSRTAFIYIYIYIYLFILLVRFTQGMDGLQGVAGMMKLLVMKWIIPSFPA